MKHLEEAVEYARAQENGFFLADARGNSQATEAKKTQTGEILFFPRKKLKMQKIRSGPWNPRAWFIQERLKEKVTKLDNPTELTHEGITSGFRSAIIKETDQSYVRIKGVSQIARVKANLSKDSAYTGRGLCFLTEALSEQIANFVLFAEDLTAITILPEYIELHQTLEAKNINRTIREFGKRRFLFDINKAGHIPMNRVIDYLSNTFDNLDRIFGEDHDFRYRAISAFKIRGDTRLDEAIYQLTRKSLAGEKRELRDDLLYHLCFWAGVAKAQLTEKGFSWGERHDDTNNHPGNFVLFSQGGILRIGLCDLSRLKQIHRFNSKREFLDFTEQELESLREDLRGNTCSLPSDLPYRHFPEDLRENCFQAIKTGYGVYMTSEARHSKSVYKPPKPDKIVVPSRLMLTEADFRQAIDYVMS